MALSRHGDTWGQCPSHGCHKLQWSFALHVSCHCQTWIAVAQLMLICKEVVWACQSPCLLPHHVHPLFLKWLGTMGEQTVIVSSPTPHTMLSNLGLCHPSLWYPCIWTNDTSHPFFACHSTCCRWIANHYGSSELLLHQCPPSSFPSSVLPSGGALYIMFENHVRSWPLLKTPSIRKVICLDTFVYKCILF